MYRKIIVYLVCALLHVEQGSQRLQADTIELVTYMDFPPYITDKMPKGGIMTEIMRASFAVSGHDIDLILMPWKRAYRVVEEGDFLATYIWSYSEQRAKDFLVSVPVIAYGNVMYSTLPDLKYWQQIRGRFKRGLQTVICVPLGWQLHDSLSVMRETGELTFVEPEKVKSCLELMQVGRVHIILIPRMTFMFTQAQIMQDNKAVKSLRPKIYEIAGPSSGMRSGHVFFTRNPDGGRLKVLFDKGFRTIVENGVYLKILNRYLAKFSIAERQAVYRELINVGILDN